MFRLISVFVVMPSLKSHVSSKMCHVVFFFFFQVTERVTIFVLDANDEKPEFKNMPAIINVVEVSKAKHISTINLLVLNKTNFQHKIKKMQPHLPADMENKLHWSTV